MSKKECEICNKLIKGKGIALEYYPTPWEKPVSESVCSDGCSQKWFEQEEMFFCETCERNILESRGLLGFVMENDGTLECVGCWQERVKKTGLSEESFSDDKGSPKSTISRECCDFFNHGELLSEGYIKEVCLFVKTSNDVKAFNEEALKHIRSGNIVLTEFESSGMNMEGYLNIWIKKEKKHAKSKAA